jgi:RimJ/RimL family protein N-acetyltransferase
MRQPTPILLAPLRNEDQAALFSWINDRALRLMNAPYRPVHAEEHRAWFEALPRRSELAIFGIRLAETDRLIGSCQLHGIHAVHRSAELQIRIGEAGERGKGYGVEAIRLLLDFAFKDLNLHRVYLHVFADNSAAIRCYQKAGFVREGLLRQAAHIDGRYVDIAVMAILRGEHLHD